MLVDMPLLSALIWLPIAGGILVLVVGDARIQIGRWLSLIVALITFVLSVPLFTTFDTSTHFK